MKKVAKNHKDLPHIFRIPKTLGQKSADLITNGQEAGHLFSDSSYFSQSGWQPMDIFF